jgi:hypothetical protein
VSNETNGERWKIFQREVSGQVASIIVRGDNLFDGDLENLSEDAALEDGEELSRKGVFAPRS